MHYQIHVYSTFILVCSLLNIAFGQFYLNQNRNKKEIKNDNKRKQIDSLWSIQNESKISYSGKYLKWNKFSYMV